jgi:RNA polymerase subunit RPABC4/transcription elongation factor Spt4
MSDNFQACPSCESLILSDTESCPECGHVFKEGVVAPAIVMHERASTVHQQCPKCDDEVPAGLVRCWSCNTFMREDVAEKYKKLVDNPQKIIFSDVPPDERTETIPPRATKGGYARILDAEDDEFTLQGEEDSAAAEFELNSAAESSPTTLSRTPTSASIPVSTNGKPAVESEEKADRSDPESARSTESAPKPDAAASDDAPPAKEANADDLLDIALTQEKESDQRKRKRRAALHRKRILIPCPACGVWLRIREEQAGKTVRCRGCQVTVPVPEIRKKDKATSEVAVPGVELEWLEDVHLHLVTPTEISLKPGSLQDSFQLADVVFNDDGLQLITLGGPPKKKSLFSRGGSDDVAENRTEVREHIAKSGGFTKLPHGELHTVATETLSAIQLVQPVRKAHESMFAGVQVFGEGRIAVYLPLMLEGGQQAFCSMPLNLSRKFFRHLKSVGVELPAKANGVPEKEHHISPLCHYTQAKVESIREVVYYTNDDAFELELTGYRCAACGIAVSESGRAKNKLGGSAGKSIAKAKCPKCTAKFGNEPMYRIAKAPESIESDSETSEASADKV